MISGAGAAVGSKLMLPSCRPMAGGLMCYAAGHTGASMQRSLWHAGASGRRKAEGDRWPCRTADSGGRRMGRLPWPAGQADEAQGRARPWGRGVGALWGGGGGGSGRRRRARDGDARPGRRWLGFSSFSACSSTGERERTGERREYREMCNRARVKRVI